MRAWRIDRVAVVPRRREAREARISNSSRLAHRLTGRPGRVAAVNRDGDRVAVRRRRADGAGLR